MNLYCYSLNSIHTLPHWLTCSTASLPKGRQKQHFSMGRISWCFFEISSVCPWSTTTLPRSGGVRPGHGFSCPHSSHSSTPRLYTSLACVWEQIACMLRPYPVCDVSNFTEEPLNDGHMEQTLYLY